MLTWLTWSVSGDDAGDFIISSDGVLRFNTAPDYDTDNVYMVTVDADDGTYDGLAVT